MSGRHEFTVGHRWSLPEPAGHIRSTSFLPDSVLGGQGAAFDADLAATLGPYGGGTFTETVEFAYELAVSTRPYRLLTARLPARESRHNDRNGQKGGAPSMYEMEGAPPGSSRRACR